MIKPTLVLIFSTLFLSPLTPPGNTEDPGALIEAMWARWQGVKDYTCIFTKQERINEKLLPEQTIFMKVREKPFSIYMKWVGKKCKGQEALYVAGKNHGKVKVHQGGILGIINLNLDPEGGRAMKDNRHPITEAGIGYTTHLIWADLVRARKNNEGEITILAEDTDSQTDCRCFRADLPPEKVKRGLKKTSPEEYYAAGAETCLDAGSLLLSSITIYDPAGELLEQYRYREVKINVGLTDRDFDPDNSEYRF